MLGRTDKLLHQFSHISAGLIAAVLFVHGGYLQAQSVISIDAGQTLTRSDLQQLLFDGQSFSLGANTTFEVNNNGRIDTLSGTGGAGARFDFADSTVVVDSGGAIESFLVDNLRLHMKSGSMANAEVWAFDSDLVISGGEISGSARLLGGTFTMDSGSIGEDSLLSRATVVISGGEVGRDLEVSASTVSISGGSVGSNFSVTGGILNYSGGRISSGFRVSDHVSGQQSTINIIGEEFYLNNVSNSESAVSLEYRDVLSGTLEDGSPFIFTGASFESFDGPIPINLVRTDVPSADLTPIIVDSINTNLNGLRAGQHLTLKSGGELQRDFTVVRGSLIVDGGAVNSGLAVSGSTARFNAGSIGDNSRIYRGSDVQFNGASVGRDMQIHGARAEVNAGSIGNRFMVTGNSEISVNGGTIGDEFIAASSTVNVSGGSIGIDFLSNGSTVNISGGSISYEFTSQLGGVVNLTGGSIGPRFRAGGGTLNIAGGEYRLNGTPFVGSTLNLEPTDVFSGVLEDGSPFVFSGMALDQLGITNLATTPVPPAHGEPRVVSANSSPILHGLRAGEELTVERDGQLPNSFTLIGGRLNVNGGTVGNGLEVLNAEVNISDGSIVGFRGEAYAGAVVNITGGSLGSIDANGGSTINISGGSLGGNSNASRGSTVNLSGGTIGRGFDAIGSLINVSGGLIREDFEAESESTIIVTGGKISSGFKIEDSSLQIHGGEPSSITARNSDVEITGGIVRGTIDLGFNSTARISGGQASFDVGNGSLDVTGGVVNRLEISGGPVTISAGRVNTLWAESNSDVTISGGEIGPHLRAHPNSTVNISGGVFGAGFDAQADSEVMLHGGEFQLNGSPYAGESITLADSDTFTGTLADGSPFIYSKHLGDHLAGIRLFQAQLPARNLDRMIVDSGTSLAPRGLRQGQELVLEDGGELGDYFAVIGAQFTINGGQVGRGVEVIDAEVLQHGGAIRDSLDVINSSVTVTGGTIGSGDIFDNRVFNVYSGSDVIISGGHIVSLIRAHNGSTVEISGGVIESNFNAREGSVVNVSGGDLGFAFQAFSGSKVNVTGGRLGFSFHAQSGSDVTLHGGEFLLNGIPYNEPTITLPRGGENLFTGTFSDGTPFIFTPSDGLNDVKLFTTSLPTVDLTPMVITANSMEVPDGLRHGQDLTVGPGADLGSNFAVVGAALNIEGGTVGDGLHLADGIVNMTSGIIGSEFRTYAGSTVNIMDGQVGGSFEAFADSTVNVSGGSIESFFSAHDGSTVNISGGNFGNLFSARAGSVVKISGGSFGYGFRANADSSIKLIVTELSLERVPQELSPGVPIDIDTSDDFFLEARLLDGSLLVFDYDRVGNPRLEDDIFSSSTKLTVVLIPEPPTLFMTIILGVWACSFSRWT